jgi:hypothetical protein
MTALQLGIMIVLAAITSGVPQQATSGGAATLQGTKWQLVKFQGGDDRTLTHRRTRQVHDRVCGRRTAGGARGLQPRSWDLEGHRIEADGGIYEFAPVAAAR